LVWHVRGSDEAKANKLAFKLMHDYWAKGRDIEKSNVLAEVASEVGVSVDTVATAAADANAAKACADETATAAEMGVFGAPHMLVDGEPFWGHDRIRYIDMWLEKRAAGN
jgi:2-hydroxychromene-2-carboxylate isomerase